MKKKGYMQPRVFFIYIALIIFASPCIGQDTSCEDTFTYIYENGIWGRNEDGTPSSGYGSWLQYARPYKNFLESFIRINQIQSVLDIGCGDWAFSRYINWGGVNYVGIDVVKQVIDRNAQQFSSATIGFIHGDILRMDYPLADLLVCKDVLQHLTNEEIKIFLSKIGKFKHCLITNDAIEESEKNDFVNSDIFDHGPNRPLDLTKPPFNIIGVKILTYPIGSEIKQVLYIQNQD